MTDAVRPPPEVLFGRGPQPYTYTRSYDRAQKVSFQLSM